MTTAAIYARVSIPPKRTVLYAPPEMGALALDGTARVMETRHQQDTENQLQALRDFASNSGWTVYREYVDQQTGKRGDRKELNAMMLAASQKKFDVVLVWSLDRLTREGALPALLYLDKLQRWGVGFRSLQESYLDTAGQFRDAIVAIVATLAKMESDRIGERTRAGQARARREGKPVGGRPAVILDREWVKARRAEGLSWSKLTALASKKAGRKVSLSTIRRKAK